MGGGKGGKGGKGDRPREEPGPRKKVGTQRVTGILQEWKAKFGWIQPDEPINHPEAKKKRGKVFLAQEDVEQDLPGVGCRVSFFLYADGTGLGAMHCQPTRGPAAAARPPQKTFLKPPGKGAWERSVPTRPRPGKEIGNDTKRGSTPPDPAARTTISTAPVQGKVSDWRGQFGFITPDEPLDLPDLDEEVKKKLGKTGRVYCHKNDVEGEMPLPGAVVIFFIYSDPNGIGAEMCQVVEQGEQKGDVAEAIAEEVVEEPVEEVLDDEGAAVVEIEDGEDGKPPRMKPPPRSRGGKGRKTAGGKGKGKTTKDKGPTGPDLPRQRISEMPVMGEVANWKGRFGWIKPMEEVDHPDVQKHKGDIYVHQKDIVGGAETLEKGQTVQFYIFSDASGLGAEEVAVF